MTSPAKRVAPTPSPVKPAAYATLPSRAVPKNAQKRVLVSIAPAQRWLNRMPSSCGNVVKKWLARRLERRRPLLVLGAHAPAVVVHRVVAAEQDAVVGD